MFKNLLKIKSSNKDVVRRVFVLNILLLASLFLSFIAIVVIFAYTFFNVGSYSTLVGISTNFSFFLILFILSKKGYHKVSAYLLVGFFYFIVTQSALKWGAGIPQGILVYSLIIVMSGILVNSAFSFLVTTMISLTITILIYLQSNNILPIAGLPQDQIIKLSLGDGLIFAVTFYFIATVSWLFNRESEKALTRARISEATLKRERDMLEVTVEKKTKEIHQIQAEKIAQLYRFAEFGKLASGFMHDLSNSVNLVSMNLKEIQKNKGKELTEMGSMVKRATLGTKNIESYITAARNQINNQEFLEYFSLNQEIGQVIEILNYKAKKSHIMIHFKPKQIVKTYGNSIKFNQLVGNLLSNAIDAYEGSKKENKIITIDVENKKGVIEFTIKDQGMGIPDNNIEKIFEPFFTTKGFEKGTGIGLSIGHSIVEKDFGGKITVKSKLNMGTTFTVKIPEKKHI